MSGAVAEPFKCCRCGTRLPLEAFVVDRSKPSGHKTICKACDRARCKGYYERNRTVRRAIARERAGALRGDAQRICARCQKQPSTTSRHRYCDACRDAVAAERTARSRPARQCEACGATYRPQGINQRTCGRLCGSWARYGRWPSVALPWRECLNCHRPFIARHGAVCCSRSCQRERDRIGGHRHYWEVRRPLELKPLVQCECRECGAQFMPTRPRAQGQHRTSFCSERCGVRFEERLRRHRKRTNGHSERFSHHEIATRDGWRCHICGKHVTRRTWSIDHLIPVSCGGSHVRANVALAHHLCNSVRGAGRTPAQLRLE